MLANINECISLNCITPTSSGTTRTASAFRCCLTVICCWAHLKEVGYTKPKIGLDPHPQSTQIQTPMSYLVSTLNMNWVCISMKVERFKSKSKFSIWSSFENFQSFIENATIINEFPCWQIRVLQMVSQLSNIKRTYVRSNALSSLNRWNGNRAYRSHIFNRAWRRNACNKLKICNSFSLRH